MVTDESVIAMFADAASRLIPHRFDLVTSLDDGTRIPVEALSEDHTVGIYAEVAPRKMRDHLDGYREVSLAELRPVVAPAQSPAGVAHDVFLEYVPLRGVRFRAEELQYLEEGWDAALPEVKYPALSVLALTHLVGEVFGQVLVYLNGALPMPLWIRSQPIVAKETGVQVAIQARAGDRMRPTNIHTECPMAYARRWVSAARGYYEPA